MKIAMYISPAHTVPPTPDQILAPWWLVGEVADGLVKRGHKVTVFAGRGSKTQAQVIDLGIEPFDSKRSQMSDEEFWHMARFIEQRLASHMYELAGKGEFDIIDNHLVAKTLPLAALVDTPTVYTLHDPLLPADAELYRMYRDKPQIQYISISNAQRGGADLPFAATIYHGVDARLYHPADMQLSDAPLIAVGRIVPQKGHDDAIAAAREAGIRLLIIGQRFTHKPELEEYFNRTVGAAVNGGSVIWEPVVRRDHMVGHYQTARALLFPIKWDEPFGLVMIEAMACGTPVVAYNHGSVAEIVRDGVTGFIIEEKEHACLPAGRDTTDKNTDGTDQIPWVIKKRGVEGLVEALKRIGEIDRAACRRHVEEHFTTEKMVERYEEVFQKIAAVYKK
jgi:glycosyltransferase involved in cell wall biosynthesis